MSDGCFSQKSDLISVEQAIATLLADVQLKVQKQTVSLIAADNHILAEDISSPINVPGFDNSAMDGYAINIDDAKQAKKEGLLISQRIPAGTVGQKLEAGCCARIFTGAPIPQGANAVVIQEVCRVENDRLFFDEKVTTLQNIRPKGNDIKQHSVIIKKGTKLRAAQLGIIASVGVDKVAVYLPIKVAIFSTGDELVEPGTELKQGQIYNSNRYQMQSLLTAKNCQVIDLGTIPDTFEATQKTLLKAAEQADLVMTSGGVSVGEEDHVKNALESVGQLTMWRIRMKPGKPLAYGRIGSVPFIGLPGNPVSVFVTFLLFARPYIQKLQGQKSVDPLVYFVESAFTYSAKMRREYVRVRLVLKDNKLIAETFARQGSDVMQSVAWSDGLVEIKEDSVIAKGDTVKFLAFSEWAR